MLLKMNLGMWLFNVNLISFEFYDFLILIKLIFKFQIIFKEW